MNLGSRFLAWTIAALAVLAPALAKADRVVLYPVDGRADLERLEEIHARISTLLEEQGHTLVAPRLADRPSSSAAYQSAATTANADFIVLAEVDPLRAQYRLHIEVYYRPSGRTEELVATVMEAEERDRLSDILSSMVRREGLGDDAIRLTGDGAPQVDPTVETDEQRAAREAEEAARREEEARIAREAAEQEAREREEREARERQEASQHEADAQRSWNARPRYETDGHWMLQVGLGGGYGVLIGGPPNPMVTDPGVGLFDITVRVGRTFDGVEGFELRGGLDLTGGGLYGIGIHAGAAWLGSFFLEPVYIGLQGEVGVIFSITGSRDVGFSGNASALFAWRPTQHFMIEASLPEIGILSPGSGLVTIGGSVRVGYRFD